MIKPGNKYLITTDKWFQAADGEQYHAAHGTVHAIVDSKSTLGIDTNRNATNWYVVIGDLVIAGCQIHYAVRADGYDKAPSTHENVHEGVLIASQASMTRIYDADASGLIAGQ